MNIHSQSYMSLQSVLQEVETGGRYGYQMDVPTYLRLKEIADQMAQYDAEMNGPSPSLARA